MAEIPKEMSGKNRSPDPGPFLDDEELYRAFAPDAWEGDRISLDAIGLPDLSVNWSRYGPPEWLLLLDVFSGFGVAAFKVKDVPRKLEHAGVYLFTFDLLHDPIPTNYPHSVIRAFDENGVHIREEGVLHPEVHLRWRNKLRQRIRLRIRPTQ